MNLENQETREALAQILEARAHAVAWRCNLPECDGMPHAGREYNHARTKQRPPWGETATYMRRDENNREQQVTEPIRKWYLRGGRGSGKTWAGSRALAEIVLWYGGHDNSGEPRVYAVVGPTHAYTKKTLLKGGSGLIRALGGIGGQHIESYNEQSGTIQMKSGAIIYSAGADNNGRGVEGENITAAWCDEVGLWSLRRWEYTYKQALGFAVRKDPALYIFTGTPKEGHPFVKELIDDPTVKVVVTGTRENKALSERELAEWEAKYAGTRLGRQELDGELLLDTPGALWNHAMIEDSRFPYAPSPEDMIRIVVGWDPAATSGANADEHGIVVAAQLAGDPAEYVVLDDLSARFSPMEAAKMVEYAFHKWNADAVVVEINNGGETWETVLRTVTTTISVQNVHTGKRGGKRLRAEPIAALSEQGRLHIAGALPKLEDQMTQWSPESPGSPDRLDAMVWAITNLMEKATKSRAFVGTRRNAAGSK